MVNQTINTNYFSICNKCYDSEFRLRCHQRAHEMRRKPREPLFCDVCNAEFNDKNSLKHHAITHIEPPERLRRLHECRFCGKTFVKPIEKVIFVFSLPLKLVMGMIKIS